MTMSRFTVLLMLALPWAPARAAGLPAPLTNILMVDKKGGAIDPEDFNHEIKNERKEGDPKNKRGELDRYVDNMLVGLSQFCEEQRLKLDGRPCKVLFYFHGGLNPRKASVGRATILADEIEKAGIYPIFVNWRSSLVSSWWDHAAHVHNGLWVDGTTVFAPYVIAADEIKAIADLPVDWIAEGRHAFPRKQEAGKLVLGTFRTMVKEAETGIAVNKLGDPRFVETEVPLLLDKRTMGERLLPHGLLLLTWWSKLLGGPLIVHAGGTGAWDIMQRRTAMLFRTEAEFRGVPPEALREERTGENVATPEQKPAVQAAEDHDTGAALAYFITRFQRDFLPSICRGEAYVPPSPSEISEEAKPQSHEEGSVSCPHRLEISLVGHSMGTIIIDRLLRYAPNLVVKNIVFMGAATSVEDYRDTVDAYLDRHKGDGEPGTQMYHLVLHPLAEATERNARDFAPRGSLLVWIDNYFTDPTTPLGRRVGRFSNVVPELQFAADGIKKQIHLKVFRVERKYNCSNPRKHGDFGLFPFWDERFWDPATPTDDTSPVRRLGKNGLPDPDCQ
jgi:hypothetical protein